MVKMSERLSLASSLIKPGNVLADVGTDHGYVPIYLLEQKKIPRAIAMDINRGPLERARENVKRYGVEDYIELRLSDGVAALAPGEADSILIAGMGGGLVIHILEAGETVCKNAGELVLQPQSELFRVRRFLEEQGYVTDAEEMLCEEGKYYPMMRVHYEPAVLDIHRKSDEGKREACGCPTPDESQEEPGAQREIFRQYGRLLLERRHLVLKEYLEKEYGVLTGIAKRLKEQPQSEKIVARIGKVERELAWNRAALEYYWE